MPTLSSQACFECRKVFKKPHAYSVTPKGYPCPECGTQMKPMGYKFKAPRASDKKAWSKIENAIREGRKWEVATVRKEKAIAKLDPKLRIALGIYGKKRSTWKQKRKKPISRT